MALAATVVWEVQPGVGNAANGGGFDPTSGTPGTDYSQQASPQITYTDIVIDGTTNTNATSVAHPFTSDCVGNIYNLTSGTGVTVQRAQLMSVAGGVATFDKSLGTLGSTGGNAKMGGALASIATVNGLWVAGNKVYQKSTGTDSVSFSGSSFSPGTVGAPVIWEGYSSVRGDLFAQSWSTAHNSAGYLTGTGYPALTFGDRCINLNFIHMRCLSITSSANSQVVANNKSTANCSFFRCKFVNTSTGGSASIYETSGVGVFVDCDLSLAGASGGFLVVTNGNNGTYFIACRFVGTNSSGFNCNAGAWSFLACEFQFASATETAINMTSGSGVVEVGSCTFVNNPGICITLTNSAFTSPVIWLANNQATGNGTWITNLRSGTAKFFLNSYNNRLRNNTHTYLGFTNITDDGAGPGDITTAQTDAQEYVSPLASPPDLHLTAAAAGKGAGLPLYLDTGAWQRQESAGGVVMADLSGGFSG